MTPVEEFKIFLIRHDLPLHPALDIVQLNPELLNKYSMEEFAILSTYLTSQMKPVQKQVKIRPLLYNACQLMAMKEKKTLIDWLDKTLGEVCKDIVNREIEVLLESISRKIR
jgi:hypothetical protein